MFRAPTICSKCRRPKPSGQRCGCSPVERAPDPNNRERAKPYSTPEWKALRSEWLKSNPVCACCGARASVVDHVRPWRGNRQAFLDRSNLQSLCRSCHSKKTASCDGGFGNPTEVKRGCDAVGRPLDPSHPWNR